MAGWHLDTKMAQDIVARTMRIIDTNINVMDARGRIIAAAIVSVLVNCMKAHCWCLHKDALWILMTPWRGICTACDKE
ncbi:putative carbohydrate diacid regulator (sugar diacid regulator) [Escherichia fergusonii]|nr:putative carbohydrate diacid regulator (sugar diacid regulator) [Escherichia fergusonii]